MTDKQRQLQTPQSVLREQLAMKEKTRLVEQQRQSRVNQQEPHGKMDQHPIRKTG
jgi:hypothetical protein